MKSTTVSKQANKYNKLWALKFVCELYFYITILNVVVYNILH